MITDRNEQIEYVNPHFTALTGYTLEEMRGQTPRMLKSGYTPPAVYQHLWETLLAGNKWHGEFCNRTKSGDIYWEWVSIAPIYDHHGEITHFVAVKEDITERKQTEVRLLQQQQALAMHCERERLARELHDTVGQVLGYVHTQAQAMHDLLAAGQTALVHTTLARLQAVTQDTQTDIRTFILGV